VSLTPSPLFSPPRRLLLLLLNLDQRLLELVCRRVSSIAARRRNSLCIAVVCSAIVSLLSSVNHVSVVVAVVVGVRTMD
jgi:hypothetical protein